LRHAGIPDDFAVLPLHQTVPRSVLEEIDAFIAVFERVTTRTAWQRAVTADAPPWARAGHGQVCFFSAWDVHLPPGAPEAWRLIELNDNGSGFMFAAIINRIHHRFAGLAGDTAIVPPPSAAAFEAQVAAMIEREASGREGLFFVLDDAPSLARGH